MHPLALETLDSFFTCMLSNIVGMKGEGKTPAEIHTELLRIIDSKPKLEAPINEPTAKVLAIVDNYRETIVTVYAKVPGHEYIDQLTKATAMLLMKTKVALAQSMQMLDHVDSDTLRRTSNMATKEFFQRAEDTPIDRFLKMRDDALEDIKAGGLSAKVVDGEVLNSVARFIKLQRELTVPDDQIAQQVIDKCGREEFGAGV